MENFPVPERLRDLAEPDFVRGFNHQVRNYQLEEIVGSGGEAIVYRGHSAKRPDEPVAVKISPASTADQAARLRAEADTIKAIDDHPGIVKVQWHSVYEQSVRIAVGRFGTRKSTRNFPYAVTEFMDGGTLDSRMRTSLLSTREVVSVLGQVLSALSWAHGEDDTSRARVIHRDIKPSNVLFTTKEPAAIPRGFPDLGHTDCVKISDFGIAIGAPGQIIDGRESPITATQFFAGTFNYMPPEQIDLNAQTQSDDYAIAVMTYRLATGKFPIPFEVNQPGQNPVLAWARKAQDDANLVPLSEANPERMDTVLEELEPIIMKSLRANWRARYPQTGDFQDAVRLAVHKGLAAHRKDRRYFDIAQLQPGSKPEPEGWPQIPRLSLDNSIAREVIPQMVTDPIPRPPAARPELPVPVGRRHFLRSISLLGAVGALTALVSSSEAPRPPETRTERQIIADAAKEIIRTMEARNLKQRTPFILKHLIPYDHQYVLGKTRQMQAAGDDEAAWLAAALATHEPRGVGQILGQYTDHGQYAEMAIVGSALNMAAAFLENSASSAIYPEVSGFVDTAIAECLSSDRTNDAYTIAAANPYGSFKAGGFPPIITIGEVFDRLQAATSSDVVMFNNLRALSTVQADVFHPLIKTIIKTYSQSVETSNELEEHIYPLLWHLASAIAPYDAKTAGDTLSGMAESSAGIADEITWPFAIELAPYNPEVVEKYINRRAPQQIPYLAAVALAGQAPERAKRLQGTAPPRYQKWIAAALNPRDGYSIATAVKDLTHGSDSDTLDELGAELTAALLVSHKPL